MKTVEQRLQNILNIFSMLCGVPQGTVLGPRLIDVVWDSTGYCARSSPFLNFCSKLKVFEMGLHFRTVRSVKGVYF